MVVVSNKTRQGSRIFGIRTASVSFLTLLIIFTAYNLSIIYRSLHPTIIHPQIESSPITTEQRKNLLSTNQNVIPKTCLKKNGPQPCILMSLGRSGTSSTWQVLGSLTGYDTPSKEYTGQDTPESVNFFNENKGTKWLTDYLCKLQKKHKKASLVGFKWKPYPRAIYLPSSQAGLQLMAIQDHPQIKVVRSKRNLLDVHLSRKKHEHSDSVASHCTAGDIKCVEEHKKNAVGIKIDIKALLSYLKYTTTEEEKVDAMLKDMGVPHILVSYEKLYNADDAEEWMRIFRFLGKGPKEGLTMKEVQNTMDHISTSVPQSEAIANYDEVVNALNGTIYENLLH